MLLIIQQQNLDMTIAVPMFISWIVIIVIAFFFIYKRKVSLRISITLYLVSFILGGIILGAIPNAVMPLKQILTNIGIGSPINVSIPMIVILALLLLSTIFFGRIFCGYACPVGAVEELLSKINFKSNIKAQKNNKAHIKISSKMASLIRWIFFGIIIVLSLIWTISVLQVINPFLGFSFIKNPRAVALLIPFIMLIIVINASIFLYRPWCRFLCPFGAIASLTSRFSIYKYSRTDACTECGLCEKICPTQEAFKDSKKTECYWCHRCVETCPNKAIKLTKKEKK